MLPSKILGIAPGFNVHNCLGTRTTFPPMIISSFLIISCSKKWFSQTLDDVFNLILAGSINISSRNLPSSSPGFEAVADYNKITNCIPKHPSPNGQLAVNRFITMSRSSLTSSLPFSFTKIALSLICYGRAP